VQRLTPHRSRNVCLAGITVGGFPLVTEFSTASLEITMSKLHQVTLPVALFVSALFLSACASTPQEEVAKPSPVAATAAPEAAPEAAAAPAAAPEAVAVKSAPAASAAEPAAKPAVKKAKKKVAKAAPKPAPVEPVAAPAPVVKEAPPVAAPAPVAQPAPAVEVTPLPKATPPGFLEQYWMWLLGIIIAIIAILWMKKKD
jgi:hypothetical protein